MKTRVFPAAETEDMKDYINPTRRDFDPDLYIFHAGTNDLSLDKPDAEIAADIINVAEPLKSTHGNNTVSARLFRLDCNMYGGGSSSNEQVPCKKLTNYENLIESEIIVLEFHQLKRRRLILGIYKTPNQKDANSYNT